jgi:hypothetical protein
VHGPYRVEDLERVVRAPELDIHDRLPARGAQLLDERTRLFHRSERVEVTVYDERRRRSGVNVEKRRSTFVHLASVVERAFHDVLLEDVAKAFVATLRGSAGPVVDAVERDHRPHRRVHVLESGLILGIVRRESHHCG